MHTLHVSVNNKVALYSARDGSIVCGNDDYQIQFALDSEWDGLPAKARFIWNGKHEDVPIVDGIAKAPIIVRAHGVWVGVYSEDGSLQTTTAARIPCDKSILCEGTAPTEGNEARYASEAQEAADRAEAAAKRAEAAGGSGGGTGGGVVIDPESVNQAQEAAQRAEDAAEAAGQSAEEAETSKNQATAAKEAAEAAQAAAESTKAEVERKLADGDYKGKDGETPEAGVDYPTFEQVDSYIAEELAKRNQFVPIPAASVEGMTDTTKIYYLTATGELYAYAPAQVVVGGYTNLADPTAEGWQSPARINESGAITTGSATGSFVTPIYPAKAGQKIYIKGVKELDTSMRRFRVATYDASGSILNPAAYKLIGDGDHSHVGPVVTVSDDGVYSWTIGQLKTGEMHVTASQVAGVRVTGGAIDGEDNVIITIDEPIVEPTIETVYKWAGTGHFISSEEAITALESRVNVLEDEVEELTVTVDRLKTNPSISMQSGAVWYALGDSITQGYASRVNASATNGYDQYVAAEGKRWVDYVAALNGYTLTNYGVGGTGYAHRTDNARAQVDGIDFSGCALVTLAYGINDFKNAGTNIGSMDDDIEAGGSFVANMRYCIKKIIADNPLCKIIVITPLNYRGLGTYSTNYSIGYTGDNASCANLDYMVDLMEQVCKYHGIEIIDMTHSSIVNRENIVAMLPDYVHPSEDCHRVMGCELARKIMFA